MPCITLVAYRIATGTRQIADGFVLGIRNVDEGQFSGACQARELEAIAPVGLDAFSGSARSHRRSHNLTGESARRQMAIDRIAARSGFIDEDQRPGRLIERPHRAVQRCQVAADAPHVAYFTAGCAIGSGDFDRIFVDVQTYEYSDNLVHGLPPRNSVDTYVPTVWLCAPSAHNPRYYRGGRPLRLKPFCLGRR